MTKQANTLYQLRQIPANGATGRQIAKALELVRIPKNAAEQQIWRALINRIGGGVSGI